MIKSKNTKFEEGKRNWETFNMVINSIFYQELSNCTCASDLLGALNPPLLIYIFYFSSLVRLILYQYCTKKFSLGR